MLKLGDFRHPRFSLLLLTYYRVVVFALFTSFICIILIITHSSIRFSTQLFCVFVACDHKLNGSINSLPYVRPV